MGKTFTYYKTYSYGGMEGRTREEDKFETEEIARDYALRNTWNDNYTLYKVDVTLQGRITEEETFLCCIPCGRELKR